MRRAEFISGLVFIAFGLFVVLITPSQSPEGQKYGLPPAGLPIICGSLIIFLAVLLTFQSRRGSRSLDELSDGTISLSNTSKLALYACVCTIGLVIMSFVGFIVGGIFIIAANMVIARHPSVIGIVLCSLITPILFYYAIFYGLRIPLP